MVILGLMQKKFFASFVIRFVSFVLMNLDGGLFPAPSPCRKSIKLYVLASLFRFRKVAYRYSKRTEIKQAYDSGFGRGINDTTKL
jgi:hypothetical protein